MMTKRDVKPFKGRLIRLNYNSNGKPISATGEITATTVSLIIFNVNKLTDKNKIELPIKYEQIESIEELKKLNQKKPVEAKC